MAVITRYRVACQIRVLHGSPLRKERQKGLRALPGTRLYMSAKGNDLVVHPRYWKIMKVVARCLRHGGEADYETVAPTPSELERGWASVAEITLHWTEKGLSYGKRAIRAKKVPDREPGQDIASESDRRGVPGDGIRDDAQASLLPDGG